MKPGTITSQVPIFLKSYSSFSAPYYQYGLFLDATGAIRFSVAVNGGLAGAEFYNTGWVANAWNHIVGTYDGGTGMARVYLNGVLVGTQATTVGTLSGYSTPLDIGAYETKTKTSGNVFPGVIDEVAVYPTALSSTRIQAHSDTFKTGCSNISGATNNQYSLTTADLNSKVAFKVTASNADGSTSATSLQTATVAPIPVPQNTAVPVVSGIRAPGNTLTTTNGSWNYASSYSYQWQRCDSGGASCSNIGSATATTYTAVSGDVGSTLRTIVTGSNSSGNSAASSAATSVVFQYAPPAVVSIPTVVGFVDVGATLTTNGGQWSSGDTYSVASQWQRCSGSCTDISGATSLSYTATQADLGSRLRAKATATNTTGGVTVAYSTLSPIDYASGILASSPIGYWRLNEASGSTATDYSGNGFTGAYDSSFVGYSAVGAPVGDGDTGTSVNGNGTRIAAVPYDPRLNSLSFSVETWVYLTALPGDASFARLVSTCSGAAAGFSLQVTTPHNSPPTFSFVTATGYPLTHYIDGGGEPELNRWYYLAATYDASTAAMKLYIDGTRVLGSNDNPGAYQPTSANPLNIGYCNGETGGIATIPAPLHGTLDEVAVYNRALSDAEIAEHGVNISAPAAQTYGDGELAVDPSGKWPGGVDSATGNFSTSNTDMSMPGIGASFAITRSYNSADPTIGPFGRGWTFNYGAQLLFQGNGDIITRAGDGQQLYFRLGANGSYLGDPGARATLTAVSGGYTLVTRDQIHYSFDSTGRLSSYKDRNNQGPTFTYDTGGHLSSITDSAGRVISVTTDTAGRITAVTLPDTRHVSYAYTSGLLTSVTDLRGGTTTYSYDASSRLATIVDQNNHTVVSNTYAATSGRLAEQIDAANHTRTYAWNAATQTATYTDPRNKTATHTYTNNVLLSSADPLGHTISYKYGSDLNTPQVTEPSGKTLTTYDANGNTLSQTLPDGSHESWTYDSMNDVLSHTNGRGYTTTSTYDTCGNLTSELAPGSAETDYVRDPTGTGLLVSQTDPRGKTTYFAYDTAGNRLSTTSPLGEVTTMTYDSTGRHLSTVDPRGNVTGASPNDYRTTFTYDDADNLLSQTDPLGDTTASTYDAVGNRLSTTDALSKTTSWAYDAANQLTTVTAPDTSTTAYTYDTAGNLLTRTDANSHVTSYTYDDANRQIGMTTALNAHWTYGYDDEGNRTSVGAPGSATISYSYDSNDRLTGIDYSDSTPDVTFSYDANGNRTSMQDGAGTVNSTYDNHDRVTAITRGTATFTYQYDAAGNVTERQYPDSTTIDYTYDDDGRLHTVANGSATSTYGYDVAGNQTSLSLPSSNGYSETRTYNNAGRVTEVKNATPASTLSQFDYTYDANGNSTQITTLTGVENYTYDDLGRITEVCYQTSACGSSDPHISYAYDPVGNRLTQDTQAGATTYNYDAGDQLTSTTGVGAATYSYDLRGNQTQTGTNTYAFNLADRMTSATVGSAMTQYSYDGDGKRLQASAPAKTTNYQWDVNNTLPQLATETDPSGASLRSYVYGNNLVAMNSAGSTYYFHHDRLGSIANVTSASGTTEWTYSYDPFGNPRSTTKVDPSAPDNPVGYVGQLQDSTTGLYDMRARMYDPNQGRFLGTDPQPGGPTTPFINPYDYAGQDPINSSDLSGNCPSCIERDGEDVADRLDRARSRLRSISNWTLNEILKNPKIIQGQSFATVRVVLERFAKNAGWEEDGTRSEGGVQLIKPGTGGGVKFRLMPGSPGADSQHGPRVWVSDGVDKTLILLR